jgi:hypothetical protein
MLLSASALLDTASGVLSVSGDGANDVIAVEQVDFTSDGSVTLQLTLNGLSDDSLKFAGVKELAIDAGGGDDGIHLLSEITVDASIVGGTGDDTIFAPDVDTDWLLNGAGSGVVADIDYSGIERLVGGSAVDLFSVTGTGAVTLGIDGGGGSDDALVGDDVANAWIVSGANAGTLNGMAFENVENLAGGTAADNFLLEAAVRSVA